MAATAGTATHDDLLAVLRSLDALNERGKTPHFYRGATPFLHFHGAGDARTADLRRGGDWQRLPAATPADRAALLAQVRELLRSGGAHRQ